VFFCYVHTRARARTHKITFTNVAEVSTPPPGQMPAQHPRCTPFQYKSLLQSLPTYFCIPTVLWYSVGVQYMFWHRKFNVTTFCRSPGHEQMISISETIARMDDFSKTHTMSGVNLDWKQTAGLWIGLIWHTASFSEHRTAPSGAHIRPKSDQLRACWLLKHSVPWRQNSKISCQINQLSTPG
jgi:hypothetical protein